MGLSSSAERVIWGSFISRALAPVSCTARKAFDSCGWFALRQLVPVVDMYMSKIDHNRTGQLILQDLNLFFQAVDLAFHATRIDECDLSWAGEKVRIG